MRRSQCRAQVGTIGRPGFTLIELLAVIAIIAVLAGLIVGLSGTSKRKAAESKALSDVQALRMALDKYRVENGSYPDMGAGNTNMNDVSYRVLTNYTSDVPFPFVDSWGNPFVYVRNGPFQVDVYSKGADTNNPAVQIR